MINAKEIRDTIEQELVAVFGSSIVMERLMPKTLRMLQESEQHPLVSDVTEALKKTAAERDALRSEADILASRIRELEQQHEEAELDAKPALSEAETELKLRQSLCDDLSESLDKHWQEHYVAVADQHRRDTFAAAALTGILSMPWHPEMGWGPHNLTESDRQSIVAAAVGIANDMIEELKP